MLGDPDHKSSEVMVYRLGPDPSFGIDFWDLRVEFDDEGCVAVTSMETLRLERLSTIGNQPIHRIESTDERVAIGLLCCGSIADNHQHFI